MLLVVCWLEGIACRLVDCQSLWLPLLLVASNDVSSVDTCFHPLAVQHVTYVSCCVLATITKHPAGHLSEYSLNPNHAPSDVSCPDHLFLSGNSNGNGNGSSKPHHHNNHHYSKEPQCKKVCPAGPPVSTVF